MPLWTDAYLADTRHLSTLEHGAYLLLLMEAWRRPGCSLPDDDNLLARLAGLKAEEWATIKPVVMAFWTLDRRSGTWRQKRQRLEHDYVSKRSKSQRDKAVKRWQATKKGDAAAMPNACRSDAPTPITKREESDDSSPLVTSTANAVDDGCAVDDALEALWGRGVEWLVSKGTPERQARSFVGRCLKDARDAGLVPSAVRDAFNAARAAKTDDPIPYITRILHPEPTHRFDVGELVREAAEALKWTK